MCNLPSEIFIILRSEETPLFVVHMYQQQCSLYAHLDDQQLNIIGDREY